MKIFGLEFGKKKGLSTSPVDNRGGWHPWIGEPYAGSWQNNEVWTVDSVLAYPPVYACVTLIANDISKLSPLLLVEQSNGTRSPIELLPVLKKPNTYQNHIQFKEWWIISKLIRGNTYALKQRDNRGNVVQLYILEPTRVQVLTTPSGEVFYQLGEDQLNGQDKTSVTVPASEIIHDRISPIFHPLVGVSPLFAAGASAAQGLKIITDSAKFFENGATPGGVLTAPGSISNDTAARLKAHWDANYTGANSGKVAVIGDGLKFEPMRMTAVDSQLIDQLRWTAEAVCSAFHVPAYKVGAGPIPSNNNVEALTQDYYSQCLQKLIEDYEICLDEGLELLSGQHTQLDLDGLFRMDTATQIKTLREGVAGAIMSPNEARLKLNLIPLEGGDTVYLQQQNFSLEALSRRDAKADPFATQQTTQAQPTMPEEPMKESEDTTTQDEGLLMGYFLERALKECLIGR
jgi:HK97 family phage portal protein